MYMIKQDNFYVAGRELRNEIRNPGKLRRLSCKYSAIVDLLGSREHLCVRRLCREAACTCLETQGFKC